MTRDSSDRRIHYMRISVTDRCDLACRYCRDGCTPVDFIPHERILRYEEILKVVKAAAGLGFDKIRLTGGEPLLRRGLACLVRMVAGVEGIGFIGLTTNGTRLADHAGELKDAGLNGVNVSLDTLDPDLYRDITGGGDISGPLRGLRAARDAGIDIIKVNMVVKSDTPGNEVLAMRDFCDEHGYRLQRIREYRLSGREDEDHGMERPLRCGDCNRIRLTADGKLLPCLHSEREIPLDFADLEGCIRAAVSGKPAAGTSRLIHDVSRIGG